MKIELNTQEIETVMYALRLLETPESKALVREIDRQIDDDWTGKTFEVPEQDFIRERNERMMSGTVTAIPWEWNPNDPRNW